MDRNVIEKFATNAVKDRILKTGCMDPNISEGDKEPSWDGTIYLYKPGCTFSKSNLEGRISVQVKGHACDNLSKDQITFDTDVEDLKNYSMDGGVLYFVVYVAESGATQVYYAELTPARLAGLLDQCTPSQKTKRIELDILPEDQAAVARIAREFREKCIRGDGKRTKFDFPLVSALTAGSFVGRERELAQIEAELENGTNPIFLSGLGGMGKTELAVKFGKSYQASGRGNVYMVTFQGSFRKTLMQTIAPQIPGLLEGNKDEKLIYDTVIHHLKQWGRDDILIIDNADEDSGNFAKLQDDAFHDLKTLPFRMIITTRCNVRLAVKAEPLEREQLRSLFDLYDVDISLEDRDALIDSVNSHTMTVDMIAQTLADSSFLSAEQVLRAMRTGVMDEDFEEIGVYHNQDPEQRRIDGHLLNLFRVADLDEDAQKVLSCAILLPQGGMDVDTFRKALPDGLSTALKAQEKRGWLKFDHAARTLTIHPVIRLVCRMALENWKEICPAFLNRLHKQQDEKDFRLDVYRQLADVYIAAVVEKIPTDRAMWHYLAAWYLWKQGQYKEALVYEQEALDRRQTLLDADDLDLAHVYNDIGVLYRHQGDVHKALEYQEKALEIRQQALPENHLDLAMSYDNVGSTYGALGDHWKELEYQEKALEIRQQTLPANHPDLARSYNNVGSTYGDLGDHWKELEYQEKALEIWQQTLPANHPDLAISHDNVGGAYGELGDYRKALEYEEKALEIRKQTLPANHPDLALSYNNVGSTYGVLGNHRKALVYKEKALEIRKQTLPANHPDLASSYNNVGITYGDQGDHRKALEYKEKALEIRQQTLPANHPDLATSYNNVGSTYGDLGDHRKALEYKEKALEIRKQTLPANHPDLALSYNNVGITYGELGDHRKALEYLEKALEIRKQTLPANHPDQALSYNNVGSTYGQLGDHRKALEYQEKALEIRQQTLPANHPDIAYSLYSIAVTYYQRAMKLKPGYFRKQELKTALQYAREALQTAQKSPTGTHPWMGNMQGLVNILKRIAK